MKNNNTLQCRTLREGEEGGQSSTHLDKGRGGGLQKILFQPFGPQFGLKIGGGPPGPLAWILHCTNNDILKNFLDRLCI